RGRHRHAHLLCLLGHRLDERAALRYLDLCHVLSLPLGPGRAPSVHCGLRPASCITRAHLRVSSSISLPNAFGPATTGSMPCVWNCAATAGTSSAARVASARRSTTGAPVPAGATR